MLAKGLLEEVRGLKERGCSRQLVSMQGLGYKEILGISGRRYDLERAVYLIKRDTRHFAKRQLTWFRRKGCNLGGKAGFCIGRGHAFIYAGKLRTKGPGGVRTPGMPVAFQVLYGKKQGNCPAG